jgi:acetyltransferase-like isoleucine patch superfamily enzyme
MKSMSSFLSQEETSNMGFRFVGENVKISRFTNFYNVNFISIGSDTRIDDFCILSASSASQIIIGNHVHISAGVYLFGAAGIEIQDFSGLSSGVKVFSASDDYSGDFLTNPTISPEYLNVQTGKVTVGKHVIIGAGTVILPGVTVEEGVAVGALSLVNKNLNQWSVYAGLPAKKIKDRNKEILKLERDFLESKRNKPTT